jgi:hypothetical protein
VIASKAHIDAIAVKLRDSGLVDGTLGHLRALALIDLTQGRDPLDRIKPQPAVSVPSSRRGGDLVPVPALINLLIPADAFFGWSTAPAQAAGWGLLDTDETRALVQAAARHPRTRWCFTLTAPDGTAVAHACATGQHPWKPPDPGQPQTGQEPSGAPPPGRATQLDDLLRRMNVTFEPITRDACDHQHAEDR